MTLSFVVTFPLWPSVRSQLQLSSSNFQPAEIRGRAARPSSSKRATLLNAPLCFSHLLLCQYHHISNMTLELCESGHAPPPSIYGLAHPLYAHTPDNPHDIKLGNLFFDSYSGNTHPPCPTHILCNQPSILTNCHWRSSKCMTAGLPNEQ